MFHELLKIDAYLTVVQVEIHENLKTTPSELQNLSSDGVILGYIHIRRYGVKLKVYRCSRGEGI